MKEVKAALIGLGFMGSTHFRIYNELAGVRVAAVADIDPVKLTGDISKVIGNIGGGDNSVPLDMTGIATYENAFEMIAETDADIIDICVPTPLHTQYLLAALKAGKHVFCEKPLCRNLEQLAEIREAVKAADGLFFNAGMCVRAWPEYDTAVKLIKSGAVGEVKSALFRRLSPSVDGNAWNNWFMKEEMAGGAALDLHLHDTDFVCHLFGRPHAVSSFGVRGVVSDKGIDHIMTAYDYGDGKLITAEGGWCAPNNVPFEMSFQIICEKAAVKLDAAGFHVYWNDGKIETPDTGDAALPTGWHRELEYFTACVRDNVTPDRWQKPDSIFDSLTVVMAEIESATEKKTVEVKYV